MSAKLAKRKLNSLLGKRKLTKRKLILYKTTEYSVRNRSLGKSDGSTQGVAGWRSSYYVIPTKSNNATSL